MTDPRQRSAPAPTSGPRRRPARAARLGALALSCAATAGLAVLFADTDTSSSSTGAAVPDLPAPIPTISLTPGVPASSPASGATVGFDGDVVPTKYGPVEVQAQLRDGQLVEIAVVEYPDDDRRSIQINADALPTLRAEVLDAQTADVDAVSGATYTSDGYLRSLQSAIDRARAAGATALT